MTSRRADTANRRNVAPVRLWQRVREWGRGAPRRPAATPARWDGDEPAVFWPRVVQAVVAAAALALAFAVAGSFDLWSARTQQLRVRAVTLRGNAKTPPAAVEAALAVRTGAPLFAVAEAELARRVAALPWVREAEVTLHVDGVVDVRLCEHVPVAALADGALWLLDADGLPFKAAEADEVVGLPILTGIRRADLAVGPSSEAATDAAAAPAAQARLAMLLRLVERVARSDLGPDFAAGELSWHLVDGVTLIDAAHGSELRLGHIDEDSHDRALAQAARLIARLAARGERLRYALLNDRERPERVVVATRPRALAAGPGAERLPNAGAPAAQPQHGLAARAADHKPVTAGAKSPPPRR